MMATAANRELLAERGLLPPGADPGRPDDLLVAVRAADRAAAEAALARVEELLAARQAGGEASAGHRPRSLAAAFSALPAARWVLVSVPGRWAPGVARDALAAGRNVFLYSDNVPLAEEVSLKAEAARRGLLVLGPDCGTAWIGGTGFGFANRVRRGRIGLVAASGTGAQAVACGIDALGEGLSHGLGTGGPRPIGRCRRRDGARRARPPRPRSGHRGDRPRLEAAGAGRGGAGAGGGAADRQAHRGLVPRGGGAGAAGGGAVVRHRCGGSGGAGGRGGAARQGEAAEEGRSRNDERISEGERGRGGRRPRGPRHREG